ncbi:MAG: methyltransferase domain-containing protein [Deltaproteobacteria bacterium]|nr:methyltransferase domain-containing protein [Deltaproteobacteria bacterium]
MESLRIIALAVVVAVSVAACPASEPPPAAAPSPTPPEVAAPEPSPTAAAPDRAPRKRPPRPPRPTTPVSSGVVDPPRAPDLGFEGSPPAVVERMLEVAEVGPDDVVYDLGSGDGRVVIAAARRGARAVGVEIDPELVRASRAAVAAAGLEDRVTIAQRDMFTVDLADATVVTLYLIPALNDRLRGQLSRLPAGARVVAHDFGFSELAPAATFDATPPSTPGAPPPRPHAILLYRAPLPPAGD